jgi:response regulator RpfG family c-di-GMP phosphodiesterase
MAEKQEEQVPNYPALARAVLVDARHGSRTEIARTLASRQLFENITHAQSVEDCKVILMTSNADACIVGPTLSLKSAKDILEVGKSFQKAGEDHCAFVAVYNEIGNPEAGLVLAKADSLLRSPFKRHQLIESVVKGVVRANANSPWRGIPLSTFGCNEVEQESSVL